VKLLGLSCGRKWGNGEVLLREALMAADQVPGVETELVRLHDLSIEPCNGCIGCVMNVVMGGPGHCAQHKHDDFHFFEELFYECDAIIISSPVYILTPSGYFRMLCDRFGPSHDAGFAECAKAMHGGHSEFDERIHKRRIAGFISVGGAPIGNWTPMGLPLMNLFTFPMNVQVLDQMQVLGVGSAGQVLFKEDVLRRAAQLGQNIAQALAKPPELQKWMGDEQGTCPVCHNGLMVVGKSPTIECAICGIQGTPRIENGLLEVTFTSEEQQKSRLSMEGKRIHFREIGEVTQEFFAVKHEVPARMAKYKTYKIKMAKPARLETLTTK